MTARASKQSSDHVKWTAAEEAILVDTLLTQKELGLQSENGWKPVVWTTVVAALRDNFSFNIPKEAKHCKSRWQRVRASFDIQDIVNNPVSLA